MTGKVLGRMLQLAGINFLYFYGELTQVQKDKAILDFKESPEQKIMVSLQAFSAFSSKGTIRTIDLLTHLLLDHGIEMWRSGPESYLRKPRHNRRSMVE